MPLPRRERRHEGMSELGQTEKNSVRANVFRYTLKLGHRLMQSARLAKQDVDGRVKPGHDGYWSKKAPPGGGGRARPWCQVAIAPRNDEFDQQKLPDQTGQERAVNRQPRVGFGE